MAVDTESTATADAFTTVGANSPPGRYAVAAGHTGPEVAPALPGKPAATATGELLPPPPLATLTRETEAAGTPAAQATVARSAATAAGPPAKKSGAAPLKVSVTRTAAGAGDADAENAA